MSTRNAALVALWLVCSLTGGHTVTASAAVVSFEGLPDSTTLTTELPGLTFTHSTVLTAGVSLNELEFPPHSAVNVAFDDGGPMTITFDEPQAAVGGFFIYTTRLTLAALDALQNVVVTTQSTFGNNEALSGDAGSSPNEFLSVQFDGIKAVSVTGDPAGESFTLDDLTFIAAPVRVVPEPSILLVLIGSLSVLVWRRLRSSLQRSA